MNSDHIGKLLNDAQRNRLLSTFKYIDELLTAIEEVLDQDERPAFRRYIYDIPAERKGEIRQAVQLMRQRLVLLLRQEAVPLPAPSVSALHAIRTAVDYIDISVAELRPRHLRGYGNVDPDVVPQLERMVDELGELARVLYHRVGG